MNKNLFKLIAIIVLIITIGNMVFPTVIVYAEEESQIMSSAREDKDIAPGGSFFTDMLFDGKSKPKQDMEPEPSSLLLSMLMIIPNIFIGIVRFFAGLVDTFGLKTFVTIRYENYPGTESSDYINDPEYKERFTLDKLFFGDIDFLNANFFNQSSSENSLNTIIKKNVAQWYFIMSAIALILLLAMMIYLAINMVLVYSGLRTPQKHATIKNTMINIVVSIVMIFLLPAILTVIANFNDFLMRIFAGLRITLINSLGKGNLEILVRTSKAGGFNKSMFDLTYITLIVVYLRFIIVYLKRFFTLAFLTIISPLVAVTYSVDKLKDDKSQVLSRFYREYFYSCFIQPLHCFMYVVFLGGLGAIALVSPLLGLILLLMFGRVEKIIKGAFDSRDLTAIRSSEEFIKGKG